MWKKIVFDGQVYAQRLTGQYRYADEILMELDKMISKDEYEIIVPQYVDMEGKFKNIKVIHYGRVKGILWTQTSLLRYLIRNDAVSVGFCNTTPLFRPGISVVHDIGYKVLKDYYKNMYGKLSSLWHRLNYWVIAKSKMPVITVSNFSKNQIMDVYKVSSDRICIIGNGWQHYNRIEMDESIFEEYSNICRNKYFFALGSLEERKNFKWIIETANKNLNETFVIAGGAVKNSKEKLNFGKIPNIIFVGFVSDGKAKALMKYCKAFIFPSTFEGFGIPPLEALSLGTKVICAEAASLPEVCEDTVAYINPYKYEYNLNSLVEKLHVNPCKVLDKYGWDKASKTLLLLLKSAHH